MIRSFDYLPANCLPAGWLAFCIAYSGMEYVGTRKDEREIEKKESIGITMYVVPFPYLLMHVHTYKRAFGI